MIFGFWIFFCICEVEQMWLFEKNVPEVWTIVVRNILGDILGICCPKWSPYVAEANPQKRIYILIRIRIFIEYGHEATPSILGL